MFVTWGLLHNCSMHSRSAFAFFTLEGLPSKSSLAPIPLRDTVGSRMLENEGKPMGSKAPNPLTLTKHRALLTVCFGNGGAKQPWLDDARNAKLPGAVMILRIFLTVGHLPTQQGTRGDNYKQAPDEQETRKGANGPTTAGTNSTSQNTR